MDQNASESQATTHTDVKVIEGAVRGLWERIKRATELIARLRVEKTDLLEKIRELEIETEKLKGELVEKEKQVKNIQIVSAEMQSNASVAFSNGEREQMTSRVKELLAKLESYL